MDGWMDGLQFHAFFNSVSIEQDDRREVMKNSVHLTGI